MSNESTYQRYQAAFDKLPSDKQQAEIKALLTKIICVEPKRRKSTKKGGQS